MLQKVPAYRAVISAIIFLTLLLGVLLFRTPGAIFPDPAWGFRVLQSMQTGSGFNILARPDPNDLSKNISGFLTWWSPGQYLVPAVFNTWFGTTLGKSVALSTALCQLLGLTGWYFFYRKAGFSQNIAAFSLVFAICQQAFFTPYIFYNGGETLLFAFLGWYLYGCLAITRTGWKMLLLIIAAGWTGFFCKSSFIWMYAAGLLFIWICVSGKRQTIRRWIITALWVGIPSVISIAVIYWSYLSRGTNPAAETAGFRMVWQAFTFPLASPLLSGFSLDDLCHGLIVPTDTPLFTAIAAQWLICFAAVMSILLVLVLLGKVPYQKYCLLLGCLYAVSVLFFTYAYLCQLNISYEARHFRIIGLAIIPGVLYLVCRSTLIFKIAFGLFSLFIACSSLNFYFSGYRNLVSEAPHGYSGIAQQFIDRQAMDAVEKLDQENKNAIFVFLSTDLCLDIRYNRVVSLPPLPPDLKINFDDYVYKGHAGPIFILLPASYIGVKAGVMMKCFPGYKGFSLRQLSDDYVLYQATQAR